MRSGVIRRLREHAGANAAIEMALLAPILIFMIVGIADYAAATHRRMQVQHAAQAGADFAMRNAFNATAIGNAVTNAASAGITAIPAPVETCGCASGSTVTPALCSTTCAGGYTAGTYINVSAQGSYTTILPYPGIPSSITFNANAMSRTR
jgi:Flp pilus assembly protein TadG